MRTFEKTMASDFTYQFTHKAEEDLRAILTYLSDNLSNKIAASNFMEKVLKAIDSIRKFPESGAPALQEYLPDSGIRKRLIGNYLLFYRPQQKLRSILVLRILYGKRDPNEILRMLAP